MSSGSSNNTLFSCQMQCSHSELPRRSVFLDYENCIIDLTLLTYLGARGMKKGDLSKFIEDAVRWRIFNRNVQGIKSRNAAGDPDELQAIIEGAVREARAEQSTESKANKT
jgi:hypothetical protein